MGYQVINEFIEKEHENALYKQGDVYPKKGFEEDPDRVAFLQSSNSKYKKAFLGPDLEKVENTAGKVSEVDSNPSNEEGNANPIESQNDSKKGNSKKKTSTKK